VRAASAIGAVVAIWACVLALVAASRAPVIAVAGSFDLTVTASAAMYFLAVRGGHLPKRAIWIVAAAGAIAARILLAGAVDASRAVFAAAATLELAAIALVIVRIRRARRAWRAERARGAAGIDALFGALGATGLPARVAGGIATELAVFAYAIAGWRRPRVAAERFTVHRVNGWPLFAGVLVALTLVETPVAHVALAGTGHATAAWIASVLSLYGALWFIGDAHALRHGGVIVRGDAIELALGVRWRGRIARDQIERVERGAAPDKRADFSILGANVVLHLRSPVVLHGLVGRRRQTRVVALSIDEPDRFVAALTSSSA